MMRFACSIGSGPGSADDCGSSAGSLFDSGWSGFVGMARTHISLINEPAYYEALGRFVHAFASAEVAIFFALRFFAKVGRNVATAIFSGTRVDLGISFLKRICEANDPGEERRNELFAALDQLKAISDVRNSILHYGSFTTDDKGRITSNISRVHVGRNVREIPVSLNILNAMTHDLEKIGQHLTSLNVMPNSSFSDRAKEIPILNDAWLYTPQQDPLR
jgi:hypothetical protein